MEWKIRKKDGRDEMQNKTVIVNKCRDDTKNEDT